jgi:HK97 family phage prohead protease
MIETRAVDLGVTQTIAAAARHGLDLYEQGRGGDGLVAATISDARIMARKGELSEAKVRKMPAWFARHAVDQKPGWDKAGEETPGYVAFLLWGGETASEWAAGKVEQLDAEATRAISEDVGKTPIIVSDVDDTILRNGRDAIDKTISFLNESDVAVVIVTGRTEDQRDETAAQLDAVGLEYAMLLTNNTTTDTLAYKRDTMKSLLAQFDVLLAVENDADVRAAYTDLGVEAVDPTNLPDTVRADAGSYVPDMPGIEQKALPMDPDQISESLAEANEAPESLCDCLAEQVADLTIARTRAHGFHFNVKGVSFYATHKLFRKVYEQMDNALDSVGESLLQLGYDAPYRMVDIARLAELEDGPIVADTPEAMSTDLVDVFDDLIEGYTECVERAELEDQQGVINMLGNLIEESTKLQWMLRATAGLQPQTTRPGGDYPLQMNPAGAVTDAQAEAEEDSPMMNMTGMTDQVDPVGNVVPDQKIRKITRPVEYASPATRANVTETGVEQRIVMDSQITFRAMTDAEDAGGMSFYGYAAAFNSPSEPLPFTETIAPGAFSRTLKARNEVKMLMNHDTGRVLASRRAGTLRLSEDSYGLRVEADLPDTTDGRDLSVLLKRGDITSMSFGFTVPEGGDYWSDENNRELRDVRLHEISVVAFPAYQASAAGVRSVDMLADKTGLDADTLAEAMNALERGEKLTDDQAAVLEESVAKLRDRKPEPTASIAELQAQLEAKMKVAA